MERTMAMMAAVAGYGSEAWGRAFHPAPAEVTAASSPPYPGPEAPDAVSPIEELFLALDQLVRNSLTEA